MSISHLISPQSNRGRSIGQTAFFFLYAVLFLLLIRAALFTYLYLLDKIGVAIPAREVGHVKIRQEAYFVYMVILVPVIEELIYRLPLIFSRLNIFIALISYSAYSVILAMPSIAAMTTYGMLMFITLYVAFRPSMVGRFINQTGERIIVNNYRVFFWVMVALFAIGHFEAFKIDTFGALVNTSIFLPGFFLLGLLFAIVRVQVGLVFAILLHSLNNALPYLFDLFLTK